jgi:polygalacturonase
MIDVTTFGAIGDGTTDDTVAIQNAIDSLVTSPTSTGGTVYFPVGDYLISAALEVSSYIELLGESLNAKILAQTPDAAIRRHTTTTLPFGASASRTTARLRLGSTRGT